jgi:hypothetical protein
VENKNRKIFLRIGNGNASTCASYGMNHHFDKKKINLAQIKI